MWLGSSTRDPDTSHLWYSPLPGSDKEGQEKNGWREVEREGNYNGNIRERSKRERKEHKLQMCLFV